MGVCVCVLSSETRSEVVRAGSGTINNRQH